MRDPDAQAYARIVEEAANWLEKIERTISEKEAQALRAWLRSKAHREAIVERCKRWHGPEILAVLGELVPLETLGDRVERQYGRLVLAIVLGVTGIATLTVLTAVSRNIPSTDAQGNPLRADTFVRTKVGEQKTIKLPDGGSILLNTRTAAYLNYEPHSRHITLLAGEAAFHAKHDPARPLTVFAGGRTFEVLQGDARFNLRKLTREQVELTVLQGQVHAHNARLGSLSPALLRARVRSGAYTFGALEGGILGPGWQSPWTLSSEEIERRVVWQSGRIVFDNDYLEDALREVERYTPWRFEVAQQELHAVRVTAMFKVGDTAEVRQYLRDQLRISSRQTEAGAIVLTRMADRTPAGTAPGRSGGPRSAVGSQKPKEERAYIDCLPNYSCRRLDDAAYVRF
jgi:transmembrane sensor